MTSKTTTGARLFRVRLTGVVGWVLVACGADLVLYLASAGLFTTVAGPGQRELRTQWARWVSVASACVDRQSVANPVLG